MESSPFSEEVPDRRVCVVGSELVENYTLVAEKKVDRGLLPPKKMLGKNSKSLVERRQKELELYLQTLLLQFPQATPAPLASFLHFHLYEINGITAALAEDLFNKGEQLLQAGEVFSLHPLQLYSVSQQLRLAKPTCCNGDAKTDLGHILDFTCRLRYLKISECSSQQIRGLSSLRSSLATLSIHYSTETMMAILVPEASEFSQWEPEGAESGCPVTAVIPVWRNLTTLDMSHNCISTIDSSVKLIPKVEFLDLSYNQLSTVENLQHLYNLVHVDLSYNSLRVLEAAHTRLGNIKTLSLAGNQLDQLTGLTKLYSLVNLDLSHNQLAQLEEIRNIGSLPCLEKLNLSSNPMCIIPDYRTKVLAQFGDRAAEVQQPAVSLSEHTHCGAPPRITTTTPTITACCVCSSRPVKATCFSCSAASCPLLSPHLLSSSFNKDFITQLSDHLSSILKEQKRNSTEENEKEEEREEEKTSESREVQSHVEGTDVGSLSPGSRDGYFEMGLDDSVEESVCSSSTSLAVPSAEEPDGHQGRLCKEEEGEGEEEEEVSRVLWCYCLQLKEEVEQKEACLVLTDKLLGLLYLSDDFTWTNQDADQEQSPPVEELLSSLQIDLLVPYSQLLFFSQAELPDSCLAFGLQAGSTSWYIFSEAEELRQTRTELTALIQVAGSQTDLAMSNSPQLLPRSLINSWELEESQGARGGYPAHLLSSLTSSSSSSSSAPDTHPLLSDILSKREEPSLPFLLFLTHRHLWVLTIDFRELAGRVRRSANLHSSSWCRLVRVPLGSVVLHPRERASQVGDRTNNSSCPDPKHHRRLSHTVELLLGGQRLLFVFPLAQDRSSFLGELSQQRASLEGLKMVALPQPCTPCPHQGRHRSREQCCCTSSVKSHSTSSWDSSRLQVEENQPSPHLMPGLSPGLKLLAGLGGHRLSEAEEVKQVLWLSVVLYKSPESELTCCLLLSTDTIYFLLEDAASTLGHQSVLDIMDSGDPDVCLCCCLSIGLSELLSINVGLFDQYFRVVGRSADHIVCCLSRDSYGTGVFLQELMSALSLQQQLPPPEPSDQDFYSQFTNTNTGKMHNYELVHSSRVKFIYPSEEEMGDLTFIVAERKTPASAASSSSRSFNVLLYLLVFQVQIPSGLPSHGSALSVHSTLSPVLQPRTLILTSTDVFLLDEDYVSYPLPDFAKEPPSRERYQLREARRIRDLDRVLLGYQTYPQALTLVFDDLPGPDLLCHLTMDHFAAVGEEAPLRGGGASAGAEGEVQWCVFVPGADSRERLISLLARQWEALCSRELPVELTG
ncbi:Nischarin Imidazoline receptor 1 [Collichthys lucidus]|uniref:Nischarin Imidazoline receptor 1 n=1 Tax=Collichthys lucidus TaxID=240159 RepID=A0A4U5UAT1_COLLU|nr:Nischarin Imidazoline receptor 1 [Collichthys lucidus]